MKKAGLQDIKQQNKQMILQAVLAQSTLSRIELAHTTGLSPSTVTTLVSELLEGDILVETGAMASTGGRRRITLALNPNFGAIVVVEVGRKGASLHLFNMCLEKRVSKPLADSYITGNELLIEATAAIFDCLTAEGLRREALSGIGLLFQEDMVASDFNVMYSTSLSAENITLKAAMFTQFRVPVIEEFSQSYSVSEALGRAPAQLMAKNSAHISVANTVLASITVGGRALAMKDGKAANLTGLMEGFGGALPSGPAEEKENMPVASRPQGNMAGRVAGLVAVLCSMFALDVVFLSGSKVKKSDFVPAVRGTLAALMAPEVPPEIQALEIEENEVAGQLAAHIRKQVLFA